MRDFSKYRILVLGDVFLDEYQFGECTRISQEAPVPIVKIDHTKTKQMPGGAGNVAANVRSLGAHCTVGCMIGENIAGKELRQALSKRGIATISIVSNDFRTAVKTRIIAQNQQVVRLDQEQPSHGHDHSLEFVLKSIPGFDAIILSDYDKGYFNRNNTEEIIDEAKRHNKLVVVDTKPCNVEFFQGADWFTPNLKEYQEMRDIPSDKVLVTKGAEGMECHYEGKSFKVSAIRREVVDVAGAGDTVTAAFTLALVAKMPIKDAVNFANIAAGVVVGKQGTSTVTVKEVEALETEVYGVRIKDPA